MKKHRHKWKLIYTDGGTCGRGLLYHCLGCSYCLEFDKKKPNLREVRNAYEEALRQLTKQAA
jgi:hypothetical protein